MKLEFNLPKVSDPSQNAALQALVRVEKARYKATELGVSSGPIVDDFFVNDGAMGVGPYLLRKEDSSETVTGTNVYYDWKFTDSTANHKAYQITYCEDQNKFFGKKRKTGEVMPQQSGLAQIYSFKVNMIVAKDGLWKAAYYSWKAGDKACQAAEGR